MPFLFLFIFVMLPQHRETYIILDAGHGGRDRGIVVQGVEEAPINFKLTWLVEKMLKEKHYNNVVMTRDADKYVSITNRIKIVKSYAPSEDSIFISIHQNAARDDVREEMIIYMREHYTPKDYTLARGIFWKFENDRKFPFSRGAFINQTDFYVLKKNPVTSVLIEVNRMNKPYREWISSMDNQWEIAGKIVSAIEWYYK